MLQKYYNMGNSLCYNQTNDCIFTELVFSIQGVIIDSCNLILTLDFSSNNAWPVRIIEMGGFCAVTLCQVVRYRIRKAIAQ